MASDDSSIDSNSIVPRTVTTVAAGSPDGNGMEAATPNQMEVETDDTATEPSQKKRRTVDNSWKAYFERTGNRKTSVSGKEQQKSGLCRFCLEAKSQAEQRSSFLVPIPKETRMTTRDATVHLRNCPNAPPGIRIQYSAKTAAPPKSRGSASSSSTSKIAKIATAVKSEHTNADSACKTEEYGSIHSYVVPVGLKRDEIPTYHSLVTKMVIDCKLPFDIVKQPTFHKLLDYLRPKASLSLPSPYQVGGRLLKQEVEQADLYNKMLMHAAVEKGYYARLAMDGWMDVKKRHIEGVVLILGPCVFDQDSRQAGADNHGIACAAMIEEEVSKNKQHNIRFVVTDDAGQMGRARRIVVLRHPSLVLHHCFAHQINLMVRQIVFIDEFQNHVKQAILAASTLMKSSLRWKTVLESVLEAWYGKRGVLMLATLAETRWNSMQSVLATQLHKRWTQEICNQKPRQARFLPSFCLLEQQ